MSKYLASLKIYDTSVNEFRLVDTTKSTITVPTGSNLIIQVSNENQDISASVGVSVDEKMCTECYVFGSDISYPISCSTSCKLCINIMYYKFSNDPGPRELIDESEWIFNIVTV